MAEFPALPLFTSDYLGDTRHLTTLQHGAYCLMLMTAWRAPDCSLPDDDLQLARITGMDRRTWLKNKCVLLGFWTLNQQHKWFQKRLHDERIYVEQLRDKNARAGQASALKRKNRGSTTVSTKRQRKSSPYTYTHTTTDTNVSSVAQLPEWLPLNLWKAYVDMRKRKRAAPTEDAVVLLLAKLDSWRAKGHDPSAILTKSITSNWTDLYEPKEQSHAAHFNQPPKPALNKDERARAAVMRAAVRLGFADEPDSPEGTGGSPLP